MCDICRRTVCPPRCPNAECADRAASDAFFCVECGNFVPRGAFFYSFPEGEVCAECAETLDVDRILRLFRMKGTYALLDAVGAERRWRA